MTDLKREAYLKLLDGIKESMTIAAERQPGFYCCSQ